MTRTNSPEAPGLRRLLGRRSFRRAGGTPVAAGYVAAVRLAAALAHLVRRLLVMAVHETSYLARQR